MLPPPQFRELFERDCKTCKGTGGGGQAPCTDCTNGVPDHPALRTLRRNVSIIVEVTCPDSPQADASPYEPPTGIAHPDLHDALADVGVNTPPPIRSWARKWVEDELLKPDKEKP
jgi:hypothetical protein